MKDVFDFMEEPDMDEVPFTSEEDEQSSQFRPAYRHRDAYHGDPKSKDKRGNTFRAAMNKMGKL